MAEYIIDLTGKLGLGDGFAGDTDMVVPRPELRTEDGTGMASGLFNPYLRNGYMAPSTTTSVSYTFDVTPTTAMPAVEYDFENDDVYWTDGVKSLYSASSLTDTSLSLIDTMQDSTYSNKKWDSTFDLQIYEINGVRKLFMVGEGMTMNDLHKVTIATNATTSSYVSQGISINPVSTTKPSIVQSSRNEVAGAGTTNTHSITVPSGSNRVLFAVVMWPSNVSAPTVTFNGVSLSAFSTSSSGPSMTIYQLINPGAATANLVVTWGSSVSSNVVYAFTTDNTHQTEPADASPNRVTSPSTTSIEVEMPFVDPNALNLGAAYSDDVMTETDDNTSEIFDSTNTYGSDMLAVRAETGYGLQVGYVDLPATSFNKNDLAWLTEEASGYFIQELDGDYAFMRNADNGFAYVFADNAVHKLDGTITGGASGTVTRNVLLFPDYFRITDAIDYRSRLYIAVHQYPVQVRTTSLSNYTGRVGLYVWNRVSTVLSAADYIELPGVREIKKIYASPDGVLKLITISDGGLTELREFGYNDSGGVVFPVKKTLGIGAFPQVPDGLSTAGDKVMWIANDGVVYSEKGNAVTKLFQAKATGTGTTGLMSNVTGGALFYGSGIETSASNSFRTNKQGISFSYLDGSTPNTKKIYPFDLTTGSDGAQTPNQGDVYTQVKLIPQTSAVRNIRIYNAPTANSNTDVIATVKIYFNQSSTAGMTKSITKADAKRGYVDFHINKPYLHAIQIEVEWATGVAIGEDMYLPSVAVVSYDEQTTQSPDKG